MAGCGLTQAVFWLERARVQALPSAEAVEARTIPKQSPCSIALFSPLTLAERGRIWVVTSVHPAGAVQGSDLPSGVGFTQFNESRFEVSLFTRTLKWDES
jgi:hypothetical protein